MCLERDVAQTLHIAVWAPPLTRNGWRTILIGWYLHSFSGSHLYELALRHDLIKSEFRNSWEVWQEENLFTMRLPGVDRWDQRRVRRQGESLRAMCMLKSRQFRLKDLPFLAKRAVHLVMASRKKL